MDLLEAALRREETLIGRLDETCTTDLGRGGPTLPTLRRAIGTLFEMEMPAIIVLKEVGEKRLSDDLYHELCALVEESRSFGQDAMELRAWTTSRLRPFCEKVIKEVDRVRHSRDPAGRRPCLRG